MAASMLASSRSAPRSFLRIIRAPSFSNQFQSPCQAKLTTSRQLCTALSQGVRRTKPSIQQLCRQTSQRLSGYSIRHFHVSRTLYDIQIVNTPGFPESVSEGDVRWEKAVGDEVAEDEVVGEIETDKTAIQVMAPSAGVIEELLVPDGDKVVPGQELFKLRTGGVSAKPAAAASTDAAPTPAAPTPEPASPPPPPTPSSTAGPIPTTPPPVPPLPTGPMTSKPASQVPVTPYTAGPQGAVGGEAARTESRVKMNRMRLRIAQRLKGAQETYAMLTTFNEVDMSNIMELRNTYKDAFVKKHGLKLGFMSAFMKGTAAALQDMPVVNAVIDENEIVYRDYVDISVAVATPKGLVVPVVRDVGPMSYADIERALSELGEKARSGNLAIEDMDGGTFTVSNGGVFGSLMGTPIINPPQSAILGMHGIFDRPVAIKGKVEVRPMMYIALTYDHRLIDGREAVTFLRKVKASVEDPRSLLLSL